MCAVFLASDDASYVTGVELFVGVLHERAGSVGHLKAGGAPRYGTCVISMPSALFSSSVARCGTAPVPVEVRLPLTVTLLLSATWPPLAFTISSARAACNNCRRSIG